MGDAKRMGLIFGLVSLISALMAAALFLNMVRETEANLGTTLEVAVAAHDITAGTKITEKFLASKEIPKRLAGEYTFSNLKELVGKSSLVNISAGEIIAAGDLAAEGNENPDSRVVQLRSPTAVFDGNFKYGDRADIVVSYKEGDREVSEILFRGIGIAGNLTVKGEETTSLGVILNSAEVERLVWMINYGKEVRVIKEVNS